MTTLSEYFLKMAGILPQKSQIEATLFNEGFSNKVYLIHWDQVSRFVLRIPYIDCDAFYINRAEEIQILKDAVAIGLSPTVVWSDDYGAFACMFVSQPSLSWTVAHQDKDIVRIAKALAKTHCLPKSKRVYLVFDVIEHYLKMIKQHGRSNASIWTEYEYLHVIFEQLDRPAMILPAVLCHNDLNPKNFLMDDEKLWLIDWEYSGTGDALFDLAVIAKSHNLDDKQIALLVSSYQPDLPMKETLEVIAGYIRAYGLREMAWMLLKHLLAPEDTMSLEYYYEFKATPSLNPFLRCKET